jgi:hypothetical protein
MVYRETVHEMQEGRLGLGIKLKPKGIADDTWTKVLITYSSPFLFTT